MVTKTPNLQLLQPVVNSVSWGRGVNGNFAIIDAALSQFFVQANFVGIWENATLYEVGQTVVDSTNSNTYECLVEHTSASSPTTFAADRVANPSYWVNNTVTAARGRGTWATATAYVKGDFVVSGTVYAVATANHTSGATFVGDAAYWSELIDVSSAVTPDGSIDNTKFANPLTIPGAVTIGGAVTVSAGGISVVAGTTALQATNVTGGLTVISGGATITAGGVTVTAGGITVVAGGASIVGAVGIVGAANVSGALTIGGVATFNGGAAFPAGGIAVTGNSTIAGTLGSLTGLTVTSGAVSFTATTSVTGNVTIVGNTTATGTFDITGATTVTGALTNTGAFAAQTINVTASGTPANGLALPTTNTLSVYTNSTERFRFAATGALGIGGATYGTTGQALLSGGSGAAPTWGSPVSEVELIDSGSLGSSATKAITDIPETYQTLILEIIGASCSANRGLVVNASVDNGVTPGSVNLVDNSTFASSTDTIHASIFIDGYQTLPLMGRYSSNLAGSAGAIGNEKHGLVNHTGNIDGIILSWNGAGNFDAGTYNLYGVR